jgi:RNA polymerase sigma-B factor
MSTATSYELKSESLALLREYQTSASPHVRNQLVELNFGLVRREAHHWINQCTESYEDLLQVGSIGMPSARLRFPIFGGRFSTTYATRVSRCGFPVVGKPCNGKPFG